jgi:hypothetical protein
MDSSAAELDFCFDQYCAATTFCERSLRSWQHFAADHGAPLTFKRRNYEALQQPCKELEHALQEQQQRADSLQVRANYSQNV